jgi:nucleoside diphosphate kinase
MKEKSIYDSQRRVAFVFFDPWSVNQNLHIDITKRILDSGFQIADFSYTRLSACDIENIYKKNKPIDVNKSWYVSGKIYTMGVSCGLLFYYRGEFINDYDNASLLLNSLKGKSNPLLNNKGNLRFDFRAPNKSLSLMHCSDDWQSICNESVSFFSADQLMQALNLVSFGNNLIPVGKEKCFFESAIFSVIGFIRAIPATHLLVKIKARILDRIYWQENDISKPLIELYSKYLERDFLKFRVEEEIDEYLKFVDKEKEILERTKLKFQQQDDSIFTNWNNGDHSKYILVAAFMLLTNTSRYSSMDTSKFIRLLPSIFYDEWEELLFQTTLYHFDDMCEHKSIVTVQNLTAHPG